MKRPRREMEAADGEQNHADERRRERDQEVLVRLHDAEAVEAPDAFRQFQIPLRQEVVACLQHAVDGFARNRARGESVPPVHALVVGEINGGGHGDGQHDDHRHEKRRRILEVFPAAVLSEFHGVDDVRHVGFAHVHEQQRRQREEDDHRRRAEGLFAHDADEQHARIDAGRQVEHARLRDDAAEHEEAYHADDEEQEGDLPVKPEHAEVDHENGEAEQEDAHAPDGRLAGLLHVAEAECAFQ